MGSGGGAVVVGQEFGEHSGAKAWYAGWIWDDTLEVVGNGLKRVTTSHWDKKGKMSDSICC